MRYTVIAHYLHRMASNSFGSVFRITSWGESHGPAIGVVIDGCPAGLKIDEDFIQKEMDRRRPGQSTYVSQRRETDQVEILSGVMEGITTGMPISMIIYNQDMRSRDYEDIKTIYRPSHADFSYDKKYGIRDYRGGGRSSARETATRVAAGAIAKLLLAQLGVQLIAWVDQIGPLDMRDGMLDEEYIEQNPLRIGYPESLASATQLIESVRAEGDTLGGAIHCEARGVPVGWGDPVFKKLHAELAGALMSIHATRGVEIGSGWSAVSMRGSEHNDPWIETPSGPRTAKNHSGGIQGGISNGEDIVLRLAFKPVATILRDQSTVDHDGKATQIMAAGRHDPCVVPRAVPIVEAMVALVLADAYLHNRMSRL